MARLKFLKNFQNPFKKDYSLSYLNATQFSVVLIDNIFKLVIAFFLIDKIGKAKASSILSMVGAVYVIPFLLFSSIGGTLADRFSKQRITIAIKIFEVAIIAMSFLAFYQKSVFGAYAVLFLLSVQSAIFGPSKYGIIADLVSKDQVAKGNGLITSFTYLAIISGTFLGSFLTEVTNHRYRLIALFAFLCSIAGTFCAFKIRYTPPSGSKKKINPLFLKEIYQTILYTKTRPHLTLAIAGASFFLFIGAFTQLNIIPYAIEEMKLSEVAGGYLFLSTAMGIAFGSIIAGKICKHQINLTIPLLGSFLLAILLMILKFTPHSIVSTVITLVLLGIAGGMFIVPFDAYIQISANDERRGQVIGANNFFGFVGVLIASLALYFFANFIDISASSGFFLVGALDLLFSIYLLIRLSDYFIKFISKSFLNPFTKVSYQSKDLLSTHNQILLTTSSRFKDLSLLSYGSKQIFYIVPEGHLMLSPLMQKLLGCVVVVDKQTTVAKRIEIAKSFSFKNAVCCVVIENNFVLHSLDNKKSRLQKILPTKRESLLYVDIYRPRKEEAQITFSEV